jgi:hypothetical protein
VQEIRRAAAYQARSVLAAEKWLQRLGFCEPHCHTARQNGMGAHPHDSTAGPAGGRLSTDLAAHVEAIVHAAEREARAAEQAIAEHRRSAEEEVRRYLAAARLHVDAETAARTARIETLSTAAHRLADELTDAVAALTRELQAGDEHAAPRVPRAPWPATPAPQAEPVAAEPAPAAAPEPPAAVPSPPAAAPEPTWSRIESEPAPASDADRAGGMAEDDSATPLAESPRAATGPARSSAGPEDAEPTTAPATNGASEIPVPSAARLVAIEMAVGGSSRAEVETHLRDGLGVTEPEPLLDDVFGVASTAASRLAWGEP